MLNNYSHIGFLPGNSLQSSEINEIQERFYLDQTLDNIFLFNWLVFTENYSNITGNLNDLYYGSSYYNSIPINPNLIESYYLDNLITIKIKTGWYKIKHLTTSEIAIWVYLNEDKETSFPINIPSGKYDIGLDISFEEVLCSSDEADEGYFFNSNVGGYIESWIPGSNRFKLTINNIKLIYPLEQNLSNIVIGKVRTGIDNIPSGTFLIQYNNNYKINNIVTT